MTESLCPCPLLHGSLTPYLLSSCVWVFSLVFLKETFQVGSFFSLQEAHLEEELLLLEQQVRRNDAEIEEEEFWQNELQIEQESERQMRHQLAELQGGVQDCEVKLSEYLTRIQVSGKLYTVLLSLKGYEKKYLRFYFLHKPKFYAVAVLYLIYHVIVFPRAWRQVLSRSDSSRRPSSTRRSTRRRYHPFSPALHTHTHTVILNPNQISVDLPTTENIQSRKSKSFSFRIFTFLLIKLHWKSRLALDKDVICCFGEIQPIFVT